MSAAIEPALAFVVELDGPRCCDCDDAARYQPVRTCGGFHYESGATQWAKDGESVPDDDGPAPSWCPRRG